MSVPGSRSPIATIIIPTFNDVDHLVAALEIACRQTLRDLEIVVVDDNSAVPVDNAVRTIAGTSAKVTVIRRQVTGGVFAAQKTGIASAGGKYIYLGSTNDPIELDFIEIAVGALELYPAAGMFFSDPGVISLRAERRESHPLYLAGHQTYFDPDQFAALIRQRPFHISSNTVVFRADALRAIGGCRSEFGLYADWFCCTVTALRAGAVYSPRVLAYSRIHEGAFSDPRVWNTGLRTQYAGTVLRAIATEFPDICPRLRYSHAVSAFGLRVLVALREDPALRPLVGIGGLAMASLRGAWGLVRQFMSGNVRRLVRKIAMNTRKAV